MKKTIHSTLLAAALVATTASAARTVSITSVSNGNATLSFGAADGSDYTLAIGYGYTDGGAATNAWNKFSILGTVAADAATTNVALPSAWGETARFMRFFLLKPEIPDGATRLEYIESTGSQWIDTGVQGKVGVTAEIDLMCREIKDSSVLASRTTSGTDTRFFVVYWNHYDKEGNVFLGGMGRNWKYTGFNIVTNTRYRVRSVMKSGTQTLSVDGTQRGTHTQTSTFDSEATLALFALHYKDGTIETKYNSKARIYSAKIWVENATTGVDELVRDYVPCRDVNDEACLYDLVSGKYFCNSGSGTFTEGAEMSTPILVRASSATFALDGGREENGETVFGYDGSADSVVWDNPGLSAGAAFVKVGSNRAIVQTATAIGADIDVRGGAMVFSGRTCTNEFYRFYFNGSKYGQKIQIAIGDLRVYSDATGAEEIAQGIGADGNVLAANSGASRLARGQCVANFATTTTVPEGQDAKNIILTDLSEAFDGTTKNAVLSADTYYIFNNASQRWVAFRMAAGNNRVQSYLPVKSNMTWHWHPSAWKFETSVDGASWQTVDVQTDAISSSGYGSTPFVIKGFLADNAAGFDSSANVKVASGATLDATGVSGGQTLSHLTVDWTAGAGTIKGVTIAQNGVLDLVNVPANARLGGQNIPVTLSGVANGANLSTWTVRVNGAATTERLRWNGSALRVIGAMMLTFW